jgi:hypothetical protein
MRFKRSALTVLAALVISLGTVSLAVTGECQQVHAWTGPMTYNGSCTHQSVDYAYCITAQLRGTLRGEYRFYGAVDDWVEASPGDPVTNPPYSVTIPAMKPPGHQGILAGWALEVFHTKHGDLYTHTAYTLPLGGTLGIYGAASRIVGGTGRYAGATGWLGEIQNETVSSLILGQVCTP